MKILTERGDTIIEVLIALAILGFAISISYSSATRSLSDSDQSEQNSYATEIAQSQIEEIRTMVNNSTEDSSGNISGLSSITPQNGTHFCMNNGTTELASSTNCQYPTTGVPYTWYDTLTQSSPSPANSNFPYPFVNTFEVQVVWPDAQGQGQDTVTLFYRVYPPPQSS